MEEPRVSRQDGDTDAAAEESPPAADPQESYVATNEKEIEQPREEPRESAEKEYVLSFENLTVHVPGTQRRCCDCIDNPMNNFLQEYLGSSVAEHEPFHALDSISGVIKSGELCLVLGANSQSKTTLLRALSGRLSSLDDLSGSILLNGMPISSEQHHQGWRRLCPYVSASDSSHSPVLTVRETLEFAAKCTSPVDEDWTHVTERIDNVLQKLGIDHVANTVVGDENLRGVSGGQKRRVTCAEMMMDRASCRFMCLENITDGLSSSDSLNLIRLLSEACHERGYAAIISLLQPSDEIVKLFDKLLVLTSEGELAYFGPVEEERISDIFMSTGQEKVDSSVVASGGNGSISDIVLQQSLGPRRSEQEMAVVNRFSRSDMAQACALQLMDIRANAPPARERDIRSILPKGMYANTMQYQFRALASRRIKLISRNAVTWTRITIAVVFGAIIGSLFSSLENNLTGALGLTGYMFLNCFLVLMLSAAVTIPSGFRERETLFKHRSAEFYSGRVAYFASIITDAPMSILEAILLSSISYHWVGLSDAAGDFIYFMCMLIALECAGQALGRLLCALCRKQVTANALSSVIILVFGTVGGFMPNYGEIHLLLRWLSWLTPVSYAFEGLMINEFYHREIEPLAAQFDVQQDAPIALDGNSWLGLYELPRIGFAEPPGIRIFDIIMVFAFAVVYDLLGWHYIEKTRENYHYQTRRPQSRVKKSFMLGANESSQELTAPKNDDDDRDWPQALAVRNLSYMVPIQGSSTKLNIRRLIRQLTTSIAGKDRAAAQEHLMLLQGGNARFRRNKMTALMGTSGAGKTTLLDVIAGYKTGGTITGDILLDGHPKDPEMWKKISGYAEQTDILNPYLSVLETLRFTASCRLHKAADKQGKIEQIVNLMDLQEWVNFVVGREMEGEGLPRHARKRLTIAIELLCQPKVLFLDEPTTGLGSNAASLVIRAMRSATDALGLITVATIHQPSKLIWEAFDDVLLLSKGGRVAYMGPAGDRSSTVLDHFCSLVGVKSVTDCNPADFCLSTLDTLDPVETQKAFEQSALGSQLMESISDDVERSGKDGPRTLDTTPANSFLGEFFLLTFRHMVVQWRNPSYCFMRITSSMTMSLYMGILFSGDKTTLNGAVFSIGAIFFLVFVLVIPMQAAVVPLVEDRAVLYRETVSGTYSRLSYGLGQLVADQPFHMLNAVLMFAFFYFLVDFRVTGEEMGYFLLMIYLANWVIQSLGQLFALVTPNEESANGLGGLSVILSVILMGFLITVTAMPDGWVWAYWANLFRYMLQGFVTNELAGNSYDLNLQEVLPGVVNDNSSSLLLFGGDVLPTDQQYRQISSFVGLALNAEDGINEEGRNLPSLIDCTISNGCFSDPETDPSSAFVACYIFNGLRGPPCSEEFNAVIKDIDLEEIRNCFDDGNSTDNNQTIWEDEDTSFLPPFVTERTFDSMDDDNKRDTILCLMKALLPQDKIDAIERIVEIIQKLIGVVLVVLEILRGGILSIPGELILFFFSWAEFDETEMSIVAPHKWWYCMGSVMIFLAAIEVFKLIAIQKIVWTKR